MLNASLTRPTQRHVSGFAGIATCSFKMIPSGPDTLIGIWANASSAPSVLTCGDGLETPGHYRGEVTACQLAPPKS
jgi:hypothetical protein